MKHFALTGLLLAAVTSCCLAQANKITPNLESSAQPLFDYRKITLDNGLDVITLEDFSCPIVAVQVWYQVGSKDEKPDRQGYAHLFEHMMFMGTDRVSESDHFNLIRKIGGDCNAYTSHDQTVYIQTLPAEQVELALWLEAERMTFLKIDQKTFDTERKVVEEELRMRENQPYGNVFKKIAAELFSVHPYRWTPIGNLANLRATSVADLRAFWTNYYVPNNATLIIVGAIKHQKAQELANRYFGWIPAETEPQRVTVQEPPQTKSRTVVINDENAPAGEVMLVWRTVSTGERDETVLDFLSQILGSGNSSRLYRALVADTGAAVEAGTWGFNLQQDGIFVASATLPPDSEDYDGLATAIENQVQAIQTDGVSEAELEKARNQLLKELITGTLSIEKKAAMLGHAAVTVGDAGWANTRMAEIRSVTREEIQQAAKTYLKDDSVFRFIIRKNQGMELARKDNDASPITAEPELQAPPLGRLGVLRPADFPAKPPLADKKTSDFDISYQQARLPNGLNVRVISNHEVPFVSVVLGLTNGAWTENKPGTASMAMGMLTRGTTRHSEAELATAMEQYGISLSGSAEMDTVTVGMGCLTEQLDRGLALLSEVVLEPAFDETQFAKLAQQQTTNLNIREQDPEHLADQYFNRSLFGTHPYSRTAEGDVQDIKQLTPADLKQWWSAFAQPDQATLIFSGDITKEKAVAMAKQYLGRWKATTAEPSITLPPIPAPRPTQIYLVDRPGSAQAQIKVGQLGMTRRQQPDYFAGLITSAYFGGSFHSRLNENLRVKRGLTYGAFGGWRAQNMAGTFEISTFTKNESADQTVKVILEQIHQLQTVLPTDAEFYDSRSYFIGSFAVNRETPQDVARDVWLVESQKLGKNYFHKFFAAMKKADKEDCLKLAQKILNPNQLSIVVVGDAQQLKEPLSKIAPVNVIQMEK
ncbi:MAG: insulinase family protein [Planctomycetales bacterium]|nr:insulinase family protein [Planctomycetales bacterium]